MEPFYVDMYAYDIQTPFGRSKVIEPAGNEVISGFTFKQKAMIRSVFVSNLDKIVIVDTAIVIDPKMPYDGVDYTINMTLNADKTLTIVTVPIVAPGSN